MAAGSDPLEPPPAVSDENLDRLYALPLDEFVGARDALVKELRRDNKREEAAWVKRLKKPSVAAWLTNQLIRQQGSQAKSFFSAAEKLRRVHWQVAEGKGDAADLRQASEKEREAINALVEGAPEVGDREALSEATLERVRETLQAVPLDEETWRRVEAARLSREQAAAGFGLLGAATPAPGPTKGKKQERGKKDDDKERRQRQEAAKNELRRLEDCVLEERRAATAARKTAEATRKERDRLEKRLQREGAEVAASKERLARLEEEARKAKRRVEALAR